MISTKLTCRNDAKDDTNDNSHANDDCQNRQNHEEKNYRPERKKDKVDEQK